MCESTKNSIFSFMLQDFLSARNLWKNETQNKNTLLLRRTQDRYCHGSSWSLLSFFRSVRFPGKFKNSISADGLTTNIFGDEKCDPFLGYNLFA